MNSKKLAFLTIVTLVIISSVESGVYLPGYRHPPLSAEEAVQNILKREKLEKTSNRKKEIINNIENISNLIYNVTLQNLKISERIFELLRPLNATYMEFISNRSMLNFTL